MLTAWHLSLIHTSQGSAGRCLKCSHHRISLHGLLTRERQNVKMLAKEQLMSYSCLFFLLKKPLNVEVLSSPHKKSREHHQSPGFKGRGSQASLSKALPTETAAGWLQGTIIIQVASSVVSNSCLGSKSQSSQEECALGIVEADPKGVCAGDPACLNVQSVRCDYGFPSPWNVWVTVGPSRTSPGSHQSFMPGIRPVSVTGNIPPVLNSK